MNPTHAVAATRSEDMGKSREWAGRFLSDPASLPVSFRVDERPVAGIPEDWKPVLHRRRIDANILETIFEGHDAGSGLHLRVECTEYRDFPVKECTLSWDIGARDRFDNRIDRFSYHCGQAPMLFVTLDIRRDDYDYALAANMTGIWRRASDTILHGDYYPLTRFHRSAREWVAWQFDCPEAGCGLVQGIRLPDAPDETLTVHPKEIRPEAKYDFENAESGETKEIRGEDLVRDGFIFSLPRRSGTIWFYRRRQ